MSVVSAQLGVQEPVDLVHQDERLDPHQQQEQEVELHVPPAP